MPAQDPKAAASAAPVPRTTARQPVASAAPPAPPPAKATPSRGGSRGGPALLLIAGTLGTAVLVVLGVMHFSGGHPTATTTATPAPVATPNATPVPVALRLPPQPGRPWKNSLGMTYVPLGDIWFGVTETRVRDFDAFVKETNYDATGGMESLQKDGFKDHGHSWKDPGFKQSPEHPVVGVSREDASFFCKWLTEKERAAGALTSIQFYRLPTDREWSDAAGLPNETGATPEEGAGEMARHSLLSGSLSADRPGACFDAQCA
jgi:hypothetical protein